MILVAAAAIALSIAHQGPLPSPPNALPKATASHTGAGDQPDPYQHRDVSIDTFDRVRVSGPFKVAVIVGVGPAKVSLIGPPALLAGTIATVEGYTLVIRFREGATWSWNPGSGVNAVVFAPKLAAVSVEGPAIVDIGRVHGDKFSAATDGAGSIVIRGLDVGHVQLATSGAGGITVEGRARDGTYLVGESGSIDAKRLRVESASIDIAGSGSAYADVSKTANISVSGSGSVEVVGGATCIERPTNSRRVDCR